MFEPNLHSNIAAQPFEEYQAEVNRSMFSNAKTKWRFLETKDEYEIKKKFQEQVVVGNIRFVNMSKSISPLRSHN
jgi:hypothetical protein